MDATSERETSNTTIPVVPIVMESDEMPPGGDPQVMSRLWIGLRRVPRYLKLATSLMRDPDVPLAAKGMLGFATAYTISPIDLVPGFIPVAGQLDDLAVLLLSLRAAIRSLPPHVAEAHLGRAGVALEHFDDDLKATKDAGMWIVRQGVRMSKAMGVFALSRAQRVLREVRARQPDLPSFR